MFEHVLIETAAWCQVAYQRDESQATRRQALELDLEQLRAENQAEPSLVMRWLGDRLVRLGERLRTGTGIVRGA